METTQSEKASGSESTSRPVRSKVEKVAFWREHIAGHRVSGQGVGEYCKVMGLKYDQFIWWRARLGAGPANESNSTDTSPSSKFIELRLPEVQAEYTIRTANRLELSIRGHFSEESVSRLLKVLKSAA